MMSSGDCGESGASEFGGAAESGGAAGFIEAAEIGGSGEAAVGRFSIEALEFLRALAVLALSFTTIASAEMDMSGEDLTSFCPKMLLGISTST